MAVNICSHCAAENRPGARHCRQCGGSLLQETPVAPEGQPAANVVCTSCYAPLNPNARFCARCGTVAAGAAPPPAYPPPAQPPAPVAPLPFSAPTPPAVAEGRAKKRGPLLPIALIGGALLLCVCVVGILALTQLRDKLPWMTKSTDTPVVTQPPVVTEASATETPPQATPRLVERWAFLERGGALLHLRMVKTDCSTCDVRTELFGIQTYSIQLGGDRLYYWDELNEGARYVTP